MLGVFGALLIFAGKEKAIVRSEFIYETAPFPSCHASTIAQATDGTLIAAWFGGTHESAPDTAIYVSRHVAGAWTPPVEVGNGIDGSRRFACYNPVLFQPQHGPLLLFYKYGSGPQKWKGRMTTSTDGGKTWAVPHDLPHGILGPIKNKPIEVNGAILCPSSTEDEGWQVHFETTRDLGKTWSSTGPLNDPRKIGAIQPSLLPMEAGALRAVGRTQQQRLFAIDSPDRGITWGTMRLLDVPNPNSGTDAIRLKDGRYLLVYNDSPSKRTPLNLAISNDAERWKSVLVLEDKPGEYSYPSVMQAEDGLISVVYTWRRERIKHVVIDPAKF